MENLVETIELSSLKGDRLYEAADLASKALRGNLAFADIFQGVGTNEENEEYRILCLRRLFFAHFTMVHPHQLRCGIDKRTGELLCVFIFEYPDTSYSLWQKIAAGLLMLLVYFGAKTFFRMLNMSDKIDELKKTVYGDRVKINVHRMVVCEKYQGKGIGSYCLGESLKYADKLKLPVALDTQKIENVRFYQRLGFKIVFEHDTCIDKDGIPYHSWYLLREPVESS